MMRKRPVESRPPSRARLTLEGVLILVQGSITLISAITLSPVGVVLIIANAAAAFGTKGNRRSAFAAVAITAAVAYALVMAFIPAVSSTIEVGSPKDLQQQT